MADTDATVTPDQTPPPDPTTADSMSGGVPNVGQPTAPDVSQAQPQTTAADVLAGNPSTMLNQAAAVHHGRIADTLNAVGKFLGGDTSYHITTNPDGSVSAVPMESTPGQRWGRIAQAALMGAAKGFAVGQGPGGAQRAAAAGVETGMALPQAQQDQTLALAQKTNDQNQQRQLYNANIAYLNTRNLEQSWALGNQKQLASEHEDDRQMQFDATKKQLHMTDVGPADDIEQAATLYNGNPAVQQALVNGSLVIHHSAGGPPHAYIIPEDKMAQLNPSEQTAYSYSVDPKSGDIVKEARTVSANTETGRDTSARLATENAALLNAVKIGSTVKLQNAQAAKDQAAANAPPKEEGTWALMYDKDNNPVMFNNKTRQVMDAPGELTTAANKAKQDAAIEKHMAPIRDALSYANDYVNRGVFTGPGDEALQDKFFSLAKPDSGFRMSTPQIQQLQNSANIINSLKGRARHAISGTWFSDDQRKQIVDTMNMIAASGQGQPPSSLTQRPTGGGGGGAVNIPTPIAPARPGGRIPSTVNGKPGSFDANGVWTSDDGTVTQQLPGRNTGTGGALPMPKIGDVVAGRTFLGGDPAQKSSWR